MTHPSPENVKAEHALRTERAKGPFAAGRTNARRASITVRCGACQTWTRVEGADDVTLAEIVVGSECPVCGGEMALERRSVR